MLLGFLLIEFLLFSGLFLLPMIQLEWFQWRRVECPRRFAYIPWMLLAGLLLLAGWLTQDIARRLRRGG